MPNSWAASIRLPGRGLRSRSSARASSAGVRARHSFMITIVAWRGHGARCTGLAASYSRGLTPLHPKKHQPLACDKIVEPGARVIGQKLAHYTITGRLGEGGMSVV